MTDIKTFAIRVYSKPGITDACLTLQDEQAIDVPLLLFCGWYGVYAGAIPDDVFVRARALSQTLGEHVIYPLRQIRRWMKNKHSDADWIKLREAIKRQELEAELWLLTRLQAQCGTAVTASTTPSMAMVLANLLNCVTDHKNVPAAALGRLEQVATACCQP